MSSASGLGRTRSLRRPTATTSATNSSTHQADLGQNDSRNASPSRLPVKPPSTRSATTATSSTTTASRTRAPSTITGRGIAGPSSSRQAPTTRTLDHGTARPLGRAPSIRQAPPTTASSTSISRSASTARPKSSGGPPSAPSSTRERPFGHSRAKSTVTSLTSATTLRPLASQAAPSAARANPSPPAASSVSTSTTITRSHTRSNSTANANAALAPRQRPAFNTNQQHYSPAKSLAPKPLTSTFLAPPSPSKQPVNIAITAETSRLQTELLQLSLLHRSAGPVTASWHASAREKLGARFEDLVVSDRALRAAEHHEGEARALRDLIQWGSGNTRDSDPNRRDAPSVVVPLDEKVQILDQVLNGVWALSEPGGRFQRVVRAFEGWVAHVEEIRIAQRRDDVDALLAREGGLRDESGIDQSGGGMFVSDLDSWGWKKDHVGLVRMLEGWSKNLGIIGDISSDDEDEAPASTKDQRDAEPLGQGRGEADGERETTKRSGLARTLRGCRGLVHDMLAELQTMEQIEMDAQRAEDDWIETMTARLRSSESSRRQRDRDREDVLPWKLLVS